MLVRIAKREEPDQTASKKKQSDLGLCCLFMPFDMQLVFEILEHLRKHG